MTIALSPLAAHSTSPICSSPLAKPPWPPTKGKRVPPISPTRTPASPRDDSSPRTGLPIPHRRRPSSSSPSGPGLSGLSSLSGAAGSLGSAASTSPLARSHPLLGSYHLSLLHARMSAHAPHSVPTFALRIKAVGVGCPASTPAGVRAPLALEVPFKATYYDLADGFNTPWVADVDLDAWFAAAYGDEEPSTPTTVPTPTTPVAATPASTSPFARTPSTPGSPPLASTLPPPPHYPGYRVPPVGQLQILVKTPTAAIKAFVVPYDLRALPVGGRLLIRERTYVGCVASNSSSSAAPNSPTPASPTISPRVPDSPRETLRYAVQLQFACTPPPPEEDGEQAYYLARTIKLVFAQRPPERTDTVRDERADEVVPTAPADRGGEDWARVRAKYVARKSVRSSPTTSASPAPTSPTTPTTSSSSSSALKRRRPVRGFSPSCERPSTPVAVTSPRSLLSAFDPRGDDDDERAASPAAPAPAPASSLSTALASALLAPSPKPPGGTGGAAAAAAAAPDDSLARNVSPRPLSVADNLRRRDSRAERELSERLRAMELRLEEK